MRMEHIGSAHSSGAPRADTAVSAATGPRQGIGCNVERLNQRLGPVKVRAFGASGGLLILVRRVGCAHDPAREYSRKKCAEKCVSTAGSNEPRGWHQNQHGEAGQDADADEVVSGVVGDVVGHGVSLLEKVAIGVLGPYVTGTWSAGFHPSPSLRRS